MAITWPPNGSSKTSAIAKAMVPMPTMASRRRVLPPSQNLAQDSANVGSGATWGCCREMPSCFHIASALNTIVISAAPWST